MYQMSQVADFAQWLDLILMCNTIIQLDSDTIFEGGTKSFYVIDPTLILAMFCLAWISRGHFWSAVVMLAQCALWTIFN